MPENRACPCCSAVPYAECCKPLHQGKEATTPLLLMRSRYSAYALSQVEYIQKTTHPQSPYFELDKEKWTNAIVDFCQTTEFLKLEILDSDADWVSFAAHLKQKDKFFILQERSVFRTVSSHWRYLNGQVEIITPSSTDIDGKLNDLIYRP